MSWGNPIQEILWRQLTAKEAKEAEEVKVEVMTESARAENIRDFVHSRRNYTPKNFEQCSRVPSQRKCYASSHNSWKYWKFSSGRESCSGSMMKPLPLRNEQNLACIWLNWPIQWIVVPWNAREKFELHLFLLNVTSLYEVCLRELKNHQGENVPKNKN